MSMNVIVQNSNAAFRPQFIFGLNWPLKNFIELYFFYNKAKLNSEKT